MSHIQTIMVALVVRDDEETVIKQAVQMAQDYRAKLIALHVNEPHAGEMSMMMDSAPKVEEEDIRKCFKSCGFNEEALSVEVRILTGENISKMIASETKDADLLILGHRRMNTFKMNFLDSVDEGIVNNTNCPVLVVPK